MSKIIERIKEPSSWAGLGLIVMGLKDVFKLDHAEEVVTVLDGAAAAAQSGDLTAIIASIVLGVVAVFRGEKK